MAEKDLTKKKKAPLIRVSKRANVNKWQTVGMYVGAIVFSLLIGAILIASVGVNPFSFYTKMLTIGTIGNKFAYKNVENLIVVFVPLLLTSLGLSLSFKMRFWNIGGEGQFIIGAITSAAIAIAMDDALSPVLMIILMALGGGIAAGIYGLFTAVLKVKFGTNETLMTLMLNYIALYLLKYFQTKHGTDFFLNPNSERPIFNLIPQNSWMIDIGIGKFSLNISLIFAVLFTVFIYIYLNKTKHGYEICVVGDSKRTAQYAGMNVSKVVLRTMFFSAFIIGMASAFQVSTSHTLSETITNDVGWTGIVVAWLARLNPIGVFITSLLISILQFGCTQACATYSAVDSNIADLLQGIILFIVLASDFFIRYKVNIDKNYFKRKKDSPLVAEAVAVTDSAAPQPQPVDSESAQTLCATEIQVADNATESAQTVENAQTVDEHVPTETSDDKPQIVENKDETVAFAEEEKPVQIQGGTEAAEEEVKADESPSENAPKEDKAAEKTVKKAPVKKTAAKPAAKKKTSSATSKTAAEKQAKPRAKSAAAKSAGQKKSSDKKEGK